MSITRKKKQNGLFYTKAEERINTLSHAAGILMGIIVGTIFLVKGYQSGNFWAVFGIWLYLFGMLGSYVSSTLYHALKYHNPWKKRLRNWDHAAIYWHIAGSYSPVTLIALRNEGAWGWGLFGFVWLCAIIGTIVSFRKMEEHSNVETICFIVMGLSVLVAFKPLYAIAAGTCYWMIAEGVCYIKYAGNYINPLTTHHIHAHPNLRTSSANRLRSFTGRLITTFSRISPDNIYPSAGNLSSGNDFSMSLSC